MNITQNPNSTLVKIGIFYDGNFFAHVSNFYNYEHERRARLSISGLHHFLKHLIAREEGIDPRYARIIDAHYFRGRLNAYDYEPTAKNRILNERIFDDILMSEGIITHYLPLGTKEGRVIEKGVDVAMSLEAFELAMLKQYDVLVLIASDSNYAPLLRKLGSLGIRTMVLGWDFQYTDERNAKHRETVTSRTLLNEATYPIAMHELIDEVDPTSDDVLVNGLFISKDKKMADNLPRKAENEDGQVYQSKILSLFNGYGFIHMPPNNLYFHISWMAAGHDFEQLLEGDDVQFTISQNDQGQDIAMNVRVMSKT